MSRINANDVIIHPQKSSDRQFEGTESNEANKKKKLKKNILIILVLSIIALVILFLVIFFLVKKLKREDKPPTEVDITNPPPLIFKKKIESEPGFSFKTEVNQLNRIEVFQNYNETTVRNGKTMPITFNRKNIYDIFVISEKEPIEELKYCYSKLYTCAISIVSECENFGNDECEPRTILDLAGKSIPTESEVRNLQEIDDIEDLAIPLCLFNITDNNGITSIKCPKAMNEGKVKGIILDLYFYRPPGIKRIDKNNNNITVNIQALEDGSELVTETNGGICGENDLISFCSTVMNTTKDSKGNLISYREIATTNITKNEKNNYLKIKKSSVIDISKKIILKPELYKENMKELLEKLNPYMHCYEQVSEEQFKEIYELSVNGKIPIKKKKISI